MANGENNGAMTPNEGEKRQLSYDELRQAASELSMQLQRLTQQFNLERQKHQKEMQELQMFNIFKRLEFLFKILENTHAFSAEYVEDVAKEIQELMKRPENTDEKESDNADGNK